MHYEVIVEGFVLDVEVTHCENTPPQPYNRDSDWDCQGTREIEFKVVQAITYDEDGVRMDPDVPLSVLAQQFGAQIEQALWFEIDSRMRRERWAA